MEKRTGTTFDREFADLQAGIFMHELGHALGLVHGGNNQINCKPNYLSVMSYSRVINQAGKATGTLLGVSRGDKTRLNRKLDYSRAVFPPPPVNFLNEGSLIETAGINGPADERILHGNPGNGKPIISSTSGSIDWNNNGNVQSTAISEDINQIKTDPNGLCSAAVPNEQLDGHNDWAKLRYNFYDVIALSFIGGYELDLGGPELNSIEYLNGGLGSTDDDEDSVLNQNDNCLFAPNADQADSNENGTGDACDVTTTVLGDLFVTLADSSDPASINSPFDYIATIGNDGPSASQNVTFNNQLPTGVTLNSITSSQGSCNGTSTIICNLGTINSGAIVTVTIRVTPTVQGRLDNWVNVQSTGTSGTADPNIDNNESATSTSVVDSSVTYTISGRVIDTGGGIGGVNISVNGTQNVVTNNNGDYSITVPAGGVYTLTPARFGYVFNPTARTVAYISSNQIVNFTAQRAAVAAKRADFDGDGKTDVSVYRSSDNTHYVLNSQSQTTTGTVWGNTTDKRVFGDYDGDGKTDIAVFRPSDATWHIQRSSNGTLLSQQWGLSTDIPVPGDYDGDGKTDVAVWRPSNGSWLALRSSNGTLLSGTWGNSTDVPLVGDFDGDGRTDFTVYRPSNTYWYIFLSNGGTKEISFGAATDKFVPADYDGDGKTDLGVWRPSNGFWYTVSASEPNPQQNFTSIQFGTNDDVSSPGDYDGDGKDDRAVFRPGSQATWYVYRSSDLGVTSLSYGTSGDLSLPSSYFPQ